MVLEEPKQYLLKGIKSSVSEICQLNISRNKHSPKDLRAYHWPYSTKFRGLQHFESLIGNGSDL